MSRKIVADILNPVKATEAVCWKSQSATAHLTQVLTEVLFAFINTCHEGCKVSIPPIMPSADSFTDHSCIDTIIFDTMLAQKLFHCVRGVTLRKLFIRFQRVLEIPQVLNSCINMFLIVISSKEACDFLAKRCLFFSCLINSPKT